MKVAFMKKHSLTEKDWNNLVRYEKVRQSRTMNMSEYLGMMNRLEVNGGSKLASWILFGNNYAEFMEVLELEKGGKTNGL